MEVESMRFKKLNILDWLDYEGREKMPKLSFGWNISEMKK
jgi:hypothetical protein